MKVGLSSRSCPSLDAASLAAYLTSRGAETVDLRAEKRHTWEKKGLQPFIDAGLFVSFVGLTVELGDVSSRSLDALGDAVSPFPGQRLKVFASKGIHRSQNYELVRQQVRCLASQSSGFRDVLVETHRGHASIRALAEMCEEVGTGLVLDIQGFASLMTRQSDDLRALAPFIRAMQVKGFDWLHPEVKEHRALTYNDLDRIEEIVEVIGNANISITVETLAGTADHDLEMLLQRFAT